MGIVQEKRCASFNLQLGKTREILELNQLVKNLHSSIPMIALTGNEQGNLAKLARYPSLRVIQKQVASLGLTPTKSSTTVMTVVGDIIVVLMMEKIKFNKEEYAKRHHSGYLGQKQKNEKIYVDSRSLCNGRV